MRSSLIFACVIACAAFASEAAAQSPLDGPLAAPDALVSGAGASAATTGPAARHAKAKPKKVHHASVKPANGNTTDIPRLDARSIEGKLPSAVPTPAVAPNGQKAADDPLSLGMKWNGNNDSVTQTRVQNFEGNGPGSTAEVGMKLHF